MTTTTETTRTDATAVWREVAAATGPADRAVAEDGVRLAYRLAGLPEPEHIVWAGSPREGAALAARLTADGGAGRSVRDEVRTRPWAAAREQVSDRLGRTLGRDRRPVVGDHGHADRPHTQQCRRGPGRGAGG